MLLLFWMYPNYDLVMSKTPHIFRSALARIQEYIAARNMTPKTFGAYAVGDATFCERLAEGRSTGTIVQRALDYISAQEAAQEAPASTDMGSGDTAPASPPVRRSDRAPDIAPAQVLGAALVAIVATEAGAATENGAVTQ
jgi:hypothetical protein